jgi:hypothetical protein
MFKGLYFTSWFLTFLDNPRIKRKFAEMWGKVHRYDNNCVQSYVV